MLNKVLVGILLIAIIYNLVTILINCKIINAHINKNVIENFNYKCRPDQTGDGTDGYQCTLGCGNRIGDEYPTGKEGEYPYKNMFEAEEACINRGFKGLCSKQEVIDGMKSSKHVGKGQCCTAYTSDIHQSGEFKGKPIIGFDRTNEGPQQSQNDPNRDGDCGGLAGDFKIWQRKGSGAHCCGTAKYDDLALEYKKRSNVSASLLRVNTKIMELEKERLEANELNRQAETLTDVYDDLRDDHIKNIRDLCNQQKILYEEDSDTQKGRRQRAIRQILKEEKAKIDAKHESDIRNLHAQHKKDMKELEKTLTDSIEIRDKIEDISKNSYIRARECSNNTDLLVVPSLISANIIPDGGDKTLLSTEAVTTSSEPTSDIEDNKAALEERANSVPEYE